MSTPGRGLALVLLLAGCGPAGHDLTVDLLTDFMPGNDFAQIVVTVGTGAPTTLPALSVTGNLLTGARILEKSGLTGSIDVHVRLADAHGGTIATRTSHVQLTSDYALTVVIARSCLGVVCPRASDPATATECSGGICVAPECTGSTCSAQCMHDADCPTTVACTTGRCTSGACLVEPVDTRCASGMRCDPALGCVVLPPPMVRCGDAMCTGGETCTTCSGDCGVCPCIANCGGRECGDNGCHGTCGSCGGSASCNAMGRCVPPTCTPACGGRSCGPDPACGTSCGGCSPGDVCNGSGQCVPPACVPDCSGRVCGADPVCGTSCGGCPMTFVCDSAGQCVCPMGQSPCGGVCATCCPSTCTTMVVCACGNSGAEINNYCYDGCGGFNATSDPGFTSCNTSAMVAGVDNCGGACATSCLVNDACSSCSDGGSAMCGGPDRVVSGTDCGPPSNGHCTCN